ncbi:phosphoenolpyruvate--protein phosphotransferase [Saccharomonospora viridis]|jgi:phosphotransferase system enzyme I (PtsI)|uniref:Phosphoenolpyruvate-protein phosphotransferase n=2 Tax=Saccharomonospora viridis TaxID=1852 RepID=C7MS39_SACVD|nr:phosphoenolpyruvate--protein phosphotransferase [Saccharomonospora viridis]ACU98895.1 phosphoenolpyruvate--protein phosphotransferase [Saccharomonospora viridis DSM 43017]KHF44694.1 phosphoenolpyruvate-protein phosphotransferase [Saccharomonospora viridis]SFP22569.1 phosphotransferase system, enzyme I, PtsI [Saccharomonospora viridis]
MHQPQVSGVGVSPGRASGPVVRVTESIEEPASTPAPDDPHAEAARIAPAAQAVAARLESMAAAASGDAATILTTTAAMAADPALVSQAEQLVTAQRIPAARAVYEAANNFAQALSSAGGYMAERVRDIQDVRDRIIAELLGIEPPGVPNLERPSVLIARDLAPADTAALDPARVLALVTEEGGPTSHTAILARSLRIPAVVAVKGALSFEAEAVSVDGDTGVVTAVAKDAPVVTATEAAGAEWNGVGATSDGRRVKVLANVGAPADARAAAETGAEGVGLFRTEFCYLDVDSEPTVDEQRAAYAAVLEPFAGKPVIVRTLDAGADKPLVFLSQEAEPNPALGVRGIRVSIERTGVLDRQLEAIAGAVAQTQADVSVMAPMIATAEEAAWFAERVRAAGLSRVGVMIEVPSAALTAREVLDAVDFVSLGTNDLAQYTFAADRQLGAVAALNDPWQPALLRLIAMVGEAAKEKGKPAGVCGEAAADPLLARVLVGLGSSSLSMNAGSVRAVGASIASVTFDDCERAARAALAAPTSVAARVAAKEA